MRGLIVGLGSIGRRHARNWAALNLGPLAVCRQTDIPQPEPLGVSVEQFAELDAALDTRPDVVLVTNPTSLHLEIACRALDSGAHVFVEKPLSHTLHGVEQLIADASARKRHLMVGYNFRFHPGLTRVRELLDAGAIGRVLSARAEVGEYLPDWHPWEDYRQGYSGRTDLGGGAFLTFSHELDTLCWLLGPPARLTALSARASMLEIDTEAIVDILLQFPAGALGSVHLDYVRRPPQRYIELVGEQGVLRWEYQANRVLVYRPQARQWRVEEGDPSFDRNDMYLAELRHLADCVAGRIAQPLADGQQAAAVLALTLAAGRSAASSRAVDLHVEGEPVTTWLTSLGRR